MSSPLIERLLTELNYPSVTADNHDSFINNSDDDGDTIAVLFFAGNPTRFPESLDVAVVLPELIQAYDGKLRAGVVLEDAQDAFKDTYPFSIWPALVFVRQGIMLGSICKIQDWQEYLLQINQLFESNAHIGNVIPTLEVNEEVDRGRA